MQRDRGGKFHSLLDGTVLDNGAVFESVMNFEITELRGPEGLDRLREGVEKVLHDVRASIVDDLYAQQSELTVQIMDAFGGGPGSEIAIEAWCAANQSRIERAESMIGDLRAMGAPIWQC